MQPVRTIRLLVVEANPGFQYLIQQAFGDRGEQTRWELKVANDGEEALRLLFEEDDENIPLPDLILLDWNLPKVTGSEVLRRVKQHPKLIRIPILVFSSSEADEDMGHSACWHMPLRSRRTYETRQSPAHTSSSAFTSKVVVDSVGPPHRRRRF